MITIDPPLETLSAHEKFKLIDRIWESFDAKAERDENAPDWHGSVVAERLDEAQRGEGEWLSADQVRERLARRFP